MNYEEAYDRLYRPIVRFCHVIFNDDSYYADEAASKAFKALKRRWDELRSTDEITIRCWLANAVRYTAQEVRREMAAETIPLDENWGRALVEKYQIKTEQYYNPVLEMIKYEDYIKDILKLLSPPDQKIFRGIVLEEKTIQQLAEEFQIKENAMRVRWYRLQKKLEPIVKEMIK